MVEILNEMNRIKDVKIEEAELQKVKNVLNGVFARSLERPETIARFALNTARYNLPKDYYDTYLERLSRVTTDDVMAMAKKYIKPENAHIVIIGNQDEVADKLVPFANSKKVNFYNTSFKEIEVASREIASDVTPDKGNCRLHHSRRRRFETGEDKIGGNQTGRRYARHENRSRGVPTTTPINMPH